MKGSFFAGAAALVLLATGAVAEDDAGREEYMVACAGCHGESAMGDGPLARVLNIPTPDLTHMASSSADGEFPFQYAVWMIDGRNIIRAHGAEMPVWGNRFEASATSERGETAEMVARGRILSLVYYLEAIQQ